MFAKLGSAVNAKVATWQARRAGRRWSL